MLTLCQRLAAKYLTSCILAIVRVGDSMHVQYLQWHKFKLQLQSSRVRKHAEVLEHSVCTTPLPTKFIQFMQLCELM